MRDMSPTRLVALDCRTSENGASTNRQNTTANHLLRPVDREAINKIKSIRFGG
jgi:hypothetical protein